MIDNIKTYNYLHIEPMARIGYTLWDADSLSKDEAKAIVTQPEYLQLGKIFVNTKQISSVEGFTVYFNDGSSYGFTEPRYIGQLNYYLQQMKQ